MAAVAKPRSISKSEILKTLSEESGLSKKQVSSVLESLASLVGKNIGKKGPGVIALPGLVKIKVVNKPAQPARKGVMVLGQLRDLPAKPASRKVRVLPLKALKDMVK
ncbi:MAG: HU family DNA-binding protein [Planctomycetaceae bacterium]